MTVDANLSRMFLNDSVGDRKAESGTAGLPFARRSFRGEERIVDALDIFRRDAGTVFGYRHPHPVAIKGRHAQSTAARHGIFGVEEEVEKNLLQPSRVSLNGRE